MVVTRKAGKASREILRCPCEFAMASWRNTVLSNSLMLLELAIVIAWLTIDLTKLGAVHCRLEQCVVTKPNAGQQSHIMDSISGSFLLLVWHYKNRRVVKRQESHITCTQLGQ